VSLKRDTGFENVLPNGLVITSDSYVTPTENDFKPLYLYKMYVFFSPNAFNEDPGSERPDVTVRYGDT